MQPLDDDELNGLLREWQAPLTPSSLEGRVFQAAAEGPLRRCLRWLATGSIRVPVPVGIGVALLLLLLAAQALHPPKRADGKCLALAAGSPAISVSLCVPAVAGRRS